MGTLFLIILALIMISVGGVMIAIWVILKLIQGTLWIFIKILECFVKVPAPSPMQETEPESQRVFGDQDYAHTLDLHPREWRVINDR